MKGRLPGTKKKILGIMLVVTLLLSSLLIFPASAAVSWIKPRPSSTVNDFNETIGNAYTDGLGSVEMGVAIGEYIENCPSHNHNDYLGLKVSVSANTRKGINYDLQTSSYNWYTVSEPTGISADDAGVNLPLPFPVLFFGVEYNYVWVSSNGFLSFDSQSTSPSPTSIPNANSPNSLVAPFWRDLNPAANGSITCGYIIQTPPLFVISWNNVPNKGNGVPQTFQVVIRGRQTIDGMKYHNAIIFQYNSITKDFLTTVGVEDTLGCKGRAYDYNSIHNGLSLKFDYGIMGYRLAQLKIRLIKSDSNAILSFIPGYQGGQNVVLENPTNPYGGTFTDAVGFAAGLAFTGLVTGIILGTMLIVAENAGDLARAMSPASISPEPESKWKAEGNENEAYLTTTCLVENSSMVQPFDSTFGSTVEWSFTDPNNANHYLTITADLIYQDLYSGNCYAISTSVTLNMYVNAPPAVPSTPSGTPNGLTTGTYPYSTVSNDPEGNNIMYQFFWGDNTNETTYGASGTPVTLSHRWYNPDTYEVKVRARDSYNPWGENSSRTVSIIQGGGGCPFVSVWDGNQYVLDNNVLPQAEVSNGTDVEDSYKLEQTLGPTQHGRQFSTYSLKLSEFEQEHSYIDQVKLLAVDHDLDVNIAVTPDGEILTYRNPCPPISAVDNYGNNRLNEIGQIDGNISDPDTYYYGSPNDYLILYFGQANSDNAKLILRTDLEKKDECIEVQIKDTWGNWQTVDTVFPRTFWSIEVVNLSSYVVDGEDFWVRLYWKNPHRLDFVGLDTTQQENYELNTATLVSAVHSTEGNVKPQLLANDNIYAELIPDQQILLAFKLPNNTNQARTFLFYTEGHYYTIP